MISALSGRRDFCTETNVNKTFTMTTSPANFGANDPASWKACP
jgi:hypothetical protein